AIATTKLPHDQMDVYGWAEVVEVIPDLGAFVDIGTGKDILVSSDELPLVEAVWPKKADMLYVTLGRDQKGRLLDIAATEGALAKEVELAPEHLFNAPIQGHVYLTGREGAAMITKENYRGFIHHTERKHAP